MQVLALLLAGFLLLPAAASAERYLTATEARKLCFPEADRFEDDTVRFTPEQSKGIEKRSGVKVMNRGNRLSVAWQGTNLLGVVIYDHVLGKHELIDYALAVTPDGKVRQIEVLEYRESHGYEIRGSKWRDQFKGKTADAKLKLNDDLFNLSGATISCRAVAQGIKRLLATYELAVRPRLSAAAGGLPDAAAPASR